MAPGDLDPKLLSGYWHQTFADFFRPKRKPAPAKKPAATRETGDCGGCPPGCCAAS